MCVFTIVTRGRLRHLPDAGLQSFGLLISSGREQNTQTWPTSGLIEKSPTRKMSQGDLNKQKCHASCNLQKGQHGTTFSWFPFLLSSAKNSPPPIRKVFFFNPACIPLVEYESSFQNGSNFFLWWSYWTWPAPFEWHRVGNCLSGNNFYRQKHLIFHPSCNEISDTYNSNCLPESSTPHF